MQRIYGLAGGAVLFLLFISLSGCATRESVAPDAHPEKYREVYLLKSKTDPRDVVRRIAERLRKVGFQVREVPYDDTTKSGRLDAAKKVRAFAADDDQPAVLCSVSYLVLYTQTELTNSRHYGFEGLQIQFHDIKTGNLVFKATKYNYDDTVPEDLELNRQFAKISDAFFPATPNPFLTR